MKFLELAEILNNIEQTSKRLEMVDLISKLLRTAEEEIRETVFLLQGKVAPDFEGVELGIAEKIAIRALTSLTGIREREIEDELIKIGDLGKIGERILKKKAQHSLFPEELTIKKVYSSLKRIAKASGSGSQNIKVRTLLDLLNNASPLEARYIIRIVTGRMRIGVADMTIVDAIAVAFGSKEMSDNVERAYNVMPNLPELAYKAMVTGISSLSSIKISPGTPVRSMLSERLPSLGDILEKMGGRFAIEYKYDGLRIQAHKEGKRINLFSRRLENVTSQFPDIVRDIKESVSAENVILDGEAVPFNMETGEMLPFQEISRRRGRKYDLQQTIEKIPVVLFLFDIIQIGSNDLMDLSYPERRVKLINTVEETDEVKIAKSQIVSDVGSAETFFDEALNAGCEGIVAKSIEDKSIYKPGAREFLWIKYKRDYQMELNDTVDLVVVGAFGGQGRRSGAYGALLMATYSQEDDKFKTICKLGSGFSDEQLGNLPKMLKEYSIPSKDRRVNSEIKADFWFSPALVLEVKGAEITLSPSHTCCKDIIKKGTGLALRFPRFSGRWRMDKKAEEATSEVEIIEMYHVQKKRITLDNP